MLTVIETVDKRIRTGYCLRMINYFDAAGRKEEYDNLSDYEKGFLDGMFNMADKVDNEYRGLTADALAEYIDEYIDENKDCLPRLM